MNKTKTFCLLILGIALVSACKKDNDAGVSVNVSEEVADEIAANIALNNSSISTEIQWLATWFNPTSIMLQKSTSLSDTIYKSSGTEIRTNTEGASFTYDYTYNWDYGIVFSYGTAGLKYFAYYNASTTGTYEGNRIKGSANREGNWILTIASLQDSIGIINGNTTRTGNSESKVRNKVKLSSTSNITLKEVKVSLVTNEIISGELEWQITGKIDNADFNFTATVIYLGEQKAKLIIEDKEYEINLLTGIIN